MIPLIVLATVMALFGVLGYLRGVKSSLVTGVFIWLGLILINQLGPIIARTVNGLSFAVNFVLAGGLGALGGNGDRSAALEAVFERMPDTKPLLNPDGSGMGMLLVFALFVGIAFLLGTLKILRGKATIWGLLVGLTNGFAVGMFVLSRLSGPTAEAPAAAAAPEPEAGGTLLERLPDILNQLVEGGQIGIVIAVLIILFVLLATRLGHRKK